MTTLHCSINALAVGGAGVGKITTEGTQQGKTIFIPYTIPGEVVEATVTKDDKRFCSGEVTSITTPSPDRIQPPCVYFTREYATQCGGCQLQHMSITAQREHKRKLVETTLCTKAKIAIKSGVTLAGKDLPGFTYRRRVTLHLSPAGELGFYRESSNEVVPVKKCLIAADSINETFPLLAEVAAGSAEQLESITVEVVRNGKGDEERHLMLTLRRASATLGKAEITKLAHSHYFTLISTQEYQATPKAVWTSTPESDKEREDDATIGHFSQVNEQGNEVLVQLVLAAMSTTPKETAVTELYAGAGNFSLPLATLGFGITAVELDGALVSAGKKRIHFSQPTGKIKFVRGSCEEHVKKNKLSHTVLLDPPRTGAKEIVPALLDKAVKQIIYVSCSLPTLTRDLELLTKGGFSCESVQVVDMFSQTHHVECVAVLRR